MARECGGCALIDVPYPVQLQRKERVVRQALARYPDLAGVEVRSTLASPKELGYRNRAKLAVEATGRMVRMGLYRRQTDRIADAATCKVHLPGLQAALEPIRRWLAYHELARPRGPVKHLDLREAHNGLLHLTLVSEVAPDEVEAWPLDELGDRFQGRLLGVSCNHQPDRSSYVFGPETVKLVGKERFSAPVPDLPPDLRGLTVPATGFFQVNAFQVAPVARRLIAHLGPAPDGPLLDLFSGVGTWGLILASELGPTRVTGLVGIEEHRQAVDCAGRNAHAAGLGHRARFRAGRVEGQLPRTLKRSQPTRLVMNPGRPGCQPRTLALLRQHPAPRVAYLSCNPETLARDLADLVAGGFTVTRVLPVDMMPQTDQVEALALLTHPGT